MFPEQEGKKYIFNLRDIFCGNAVTYEQVLNQVEQIIQGNTPALIIIVGPPLTGKTELTNQLTRKYDIPFKSAQTEQPQPYVLTLYFYTQHYNHKPDEFKEELVNLVNKIKDPSHIILHISGAFNIHSPQDIQALKDVIKLTDEVTEGKPYPISLLVEFTTHNTNQLPFFVTDPRRESVLDNLVQELPASSREAKLFHLPFNKKALAQGLYGLITNPLVTFNPNSDEGKSELERYFGKHTDAIQQVLNQVSAQIRQGQTNQETAVTQILDTLNQIEQQALAQLSDNTE